MSIRTKLVAALVVCTTLASAVVGVLSYRSTEANLVAEVDASLENAVRALLRDADRRGPGSLTQSLAAVGEVEVQVVLPDGRTRSRPGVEGIPVSERDLQLAASSRPGVRLLRDAEWEAESGTPLVDGPDRVPLIPAPGDGDPIRVLTQSLGDDRGAIQAARSLVEIQRVLDALRRRILIVTIAVAAVSALAGWLIARQLTRRLVSVTDAAEKVASTGGLDVVVPVAGSDEAARLGSAFNEMIGALARSRADQQRLVQDAGHELRTPMTSLRTNLYNLRGFDSMEPGEREAVLADLRAETEELSSLIDEVIELATDRRGDEPLVEFDLVTIAERVAQRTSLRWEREVRVHSEQGGAVLEGRREAIGRAVRNLVENAAKFDSSGGAIDVVVRMLPAGSVEGPRQPGPESDVVGPEPWREASVQLEVLDRGPGIPESDLDHVFERFYRSDDARSAPGSGLGLSIVAEVVGAHDGTFWAANREGGGAAVCFRVPSNHAPSNPRGEA